MRKLPFISETCYTYEEALAHVEEIRRTGLIILGGDVLTPEGEYTYINWYYEPREPESACSESCDHAAHPVHDLPAGLHFPDAPEVLPLLRQAIISETHVEKTAAGYSFARLSRDHLQVSIRQIRRRQFIVFSSVPTAHLLLPDIRKVVRQGKAIMYPVIDQMREDFPQFFQGKILPA